MIEHFLRYAVPAGYSLLPPAMNSPAATACVLAIGLQESDFEKRRQMRAVDPALGFMQFERNGVRGVLVHPRTIHHAEAALKALRYHSILKETTACHKTLEHNDTLAFVFARLLLWSLPEKLPTRLQREIAWQQYLEAWRPGAKNPRPDDWPANWERAWTLVEPTWKGNNIVD